MNPRRSSLLDYPPVLLWMVLLSIIGADAWGQIIVQGQRRVVVGQPGLAQLILNKTSAANEDLAENVFLPPDRRTLQRLSQAKELIAKGRYSEAVQNLGAILDGSEDYFFQPQANQPIHRSLKAEAQRLIGQMPREGRELYELQFGAQAKQLLEEATAAGDAQGLAEVSRRFFHTRAGYEATFLLGLDHLDHGRPLAGALTLQRLKDSPQQSDQFEPALSLAMATGWLQTGAVDKAREVLLAFRKDHPQIALKAAAAEIPPTNANDVLQWLTKLVGTQLLAAPVEADRWLMFRGNPQRNAITSGSAPLMNLCWRVPVADDPAIEEAIGQARRINMEQGVATLPGLHPLVVDDVVLLRTYKNLQAVDFTTGKRLWEVPADDALENLTSGGDSDVGSQSSFLISLLSQRAWDDATFGTLSSDGRLVFGIEDPGLVLGVKPVIVGNRRIVNFNNPVSTRACNRLAAYDIHTGKLKWQVGGDAEEYGVRLPESFFLGPPLPLMSQLYVLAEIKGEIRLLALDAANGNLLWSQQLAVVEQTIQQDTMRRLTGISPSYADGILVCPTSTGALVAVELATRSLLWGYRYGRNNQADRIMERYRVPGTPLSQAADAGICVADGRVLVTPLDSDSLHCLNLTDGDLLWKYKRQDDLYAACVYQGKVIMVGRRQVRAINLSDGRPGWDGRAVALPEGVMPSGRGFFTGDRYFLPLDSAEVATIDLAKGKLDHLAKSRKGFVPGNLICYKGRVISQSYDGVDVFYQLDSARDEVERRLAANPNDPDALCMQGEIFIDAGKRMEAVDCFRRAYAANADPRSRELLRDALIEGLEREFTVYRGQNAEIEQLLDDPTQQATYLRLMAAGLQRSGDLAAAFDYCQKLVDLQSDRLPLETVAKSLSVRRDRWVQAQLASLMMEAKGESAAKIDAEIQARFQAAAASGSIESLQRFLDYFGNQPVAAKARAELVRKLIDTGRLLEAETALWAGYASSDPAANPPALVEVAEMLRQAGRTDSAALTYNWLRSRFGDAICRDGKTARQIIEALPADDALRQLIDRKDSWPTGEVDIKKPKDTRNNQINYYNRLALEFQGMPGPYFSDINLTFDQNRRTLLGSDSLGNNLWQIPLNDDRSQRQQFFGYNRGAAHVRALGHLLLISVGGNLFAVDALRAGENNPPKILWSQTLGDAFADPALMQPVFLGGGAFPGVVQMRMMQTQMLYKQNNELELELATARYVCLQRLRSLIALDTLTGATLWVRQDVPQGSAVFGDDEFVFVLPPDKLDALVLRALDGEQLAVRKIPRSESRMGNINGQVINNYVSLSDSCLTTMGRNLLFWRSENNRRVLELFDPWTQKTVWPRREFSSGARCSLVGGETIGILEPGAKFTLLNLSDGRAMAEVKLDAASKLTDLLVIPSDDRYLLLTYEPYQRSNAAQSRPTQPLIGIPSKQISRGKLYAIDQSGKLIWPAPVEIEDQWLPTNQPTGLPVIIFACQRFERPRLSILAVDKRTGRTVYNDEFLSQPGVLNVVGNAEKKTVDLMISRNTVTLTFTDNPPKTPEQEAEAKKTDKPKENTSKALFKSLGKTMDQLFGLPVDESFDGEE